MNWGRTAQHSLLDMVYQSVPAVSLTLIAQIEVIHAGEAKLIMRQHNRTQHKVFVTTTVCLCQGEGQNSSRIEGLSKAVMRKQNGTYLAVLLQASLFKIKKNKNLQLPLAYDRKPKLIHKNENWKREIENNKSISVICLQGQYKGNKKKRCMHMNKLQYK